MRLTEKGQVTVPKSVREFLGVGPGAEVEFRIEGGTVVLVRAGDEKESRGDRMVRLLREAGRRCEPSGLSTDDIMEMTRGPFDDVDPR